MACKRTGIYDGMFAVAGGDAQLAVVIGHEIGHNHARHVRERIARAVGTEATLRRVSAALQVGGKPYANQIAGLFGAGAQYGIILPYGLEQELEADEIGATNMARARFDSEGAIRLRQNMAEQPSPPTFVSTIRHPKAGSAPARRHCPRRGRSTRRRS